MAPTTAAERKRKSRANQPEEKMLKEKEKARNHMRETVTSNDPFKSPQSFGKALKKSRVSLPQSPGKKIAVVKKMAKDLGIPIIEKNTNKAKNNGISDNVKHLVQEFYYRDEISRQFPGRKDVKSFKDPDTNEKVILQKRLLT